MSLGAGKTGFLLYCGWTAAASLGIYFTWLDLGHGMEAKQQGEYRRPVRSPSFRQPLPPIHPYSPAISGLLLAPQQGALFLSIFENFENFSAAQKQRF